MATLFEYDERIAEIIAKATDEEGNIDTTLVDEELEELEMKREEKIDNLIMYIKSRRAMGEALKAEKTAIGKRQKTAENEAKFALNYLGIALKGKKHESVAGKVWYRKSEEVHVDDISKVPDEYIKYKPEPDKTAIKEAITKNGEIIEGAWIEKKVNTLLK